MVDAKGVAWNYIRTNVDPRTGTRTSTFENVFFLVGMLPAEARAFVQPYVDDLNKLGMNISNPEIVFYPEYSDQGFPLNATVGGGAGNVRFGARLFPRENFEDRDSQLFKDTINAIRTFVEEGGYTFHSVDYGATEELAGYPGSDSAVPAFHRNSVMHATGFDTASYGPGVPVAQQLASHARLDSYIQKWRDVTPDSGTYMNEADPQEPDFQKHFYGENWGRLSAIKRRVDPWDVFYANTAVGSERWRVEGTQGLPYQNGRLCRV